MVTLHTVLLLGCVVEAWALHRPFLLGLGWPMLAVAALRQTVRWCAVLLAARIRVENAALGYT